MNLVSVNTGLPREVTWHNISVTTGIFKEPVGGRIALRKLNLDGDRQVRPHRPRRRSQSRLLLPRRALRLLEAANSPAGRFAHGRIFGENFTAEGPLEDSVHLGDRFAIGSAELVVTQPRLPVLQARHPVCKPTTWSRRFPRQRPHRFLPRRHPRRRGRRRRRNQTARSRPTGCPRLRNHSPLHREKIQ